MGLADLIEAVALYQLDNPAETGFHVGRQDIELFANSVVQQFYDPRHLRVLLHFCNGDGGQPERRDLLRKRHVCRPRRMNDGSQAGGASGRARMLGSLQL
jgi:hypothetical protein